jgi:hypothetical protein
LTVNFRGWCLLLWQEHQQEVYDWEKKLPDYSSTEYFQKYKWWLKREFKFQSKQQS